MGSFSWMCACGCGREITPNYGQSDEDCQECGERILDGQEIVVLMPDGNNLVGVFYDDYGNIVTIDGEEVLEMYAWLARANLKEHNPHALGTTAFWEATREHRDCDKDPEEEAQRIDGIYAKIRYIHKETGEIIAHDEAPNRGWATGPNPERFWEEWEQEGDFLTLQFPIKIAWAYCVDARSDKSEDNLYDSYDESVGAPNQGFGNKHETDCCGITVCGDCYDGYGTCCDH